LINNLSISCPDLKKRNELTLILLRILEIKTAQNTLRCKVLLQMNGSSIQRRRRNTIDKIENNQVENVKNLVVLGLGYRSRSSCYRLKLVVIGKNLVVIGFNMQ